MHVSTERRSSLFASTFCATAPSCVRTGNIRFHTFIFAIAATPPFREPRLNISSLHQTNSSSFAVPCERLMHWPRIRRDNVELSVGVVYAHQISFFNPEHPRKPFRDDDPEKIPPYLGDAA